MKKDRNGGPCVFDETFKIMARPGVPVELSYAKGSVQEAARELGIDSSRITKWRQTYKSPSQVVITASGISQEQQLIRRLQKELKEAELEQDISRRSASFPGATARRTVRNIPIYRRAR